MIVELDKKISTLYPKKLGNPIVLYRSREEDEGRRVGVW
jgi:hypothetical protein